MLTADWPGREAATRLRQWSAIEPLAAYAMDNTSIFSAAILVGSFAAGTADTLSDIDLILLAPDGGFEAAWARRSDLHPTGVLAVWD
ncbi:MAG: nucleotidyltransferase domain-containing protein [Dehalococcoidia bacterium]